MSDGDFSPWVDGFAFCAQVRRDPLLAGVPVVLAFSGPVGEADRELARRVGAHALVAATGDLRAATAALEDALTDGASEVPNDNLPRELQRELPVGVGRSLAEVAASEDRYRAVMEQANDAILVVDLDDCILEANRQAERLLGRPRDEIVGRHYDDFVVPEEVAESQRLRGTC